MKKNVHTITLDMVHEGSKWMKISERDPNIPERTLSNGFFWTCDFTNPNAKPKIRLFDDNVWYLFKDHPQRKGWNPDYNFTHWLKQGFYKPTITEEDFKEIEDYRNAKLLNSRGQFIYYI